MGEIRAGLFAARRVFRADGGVDAPFGGDVQTEVMDVASHDVCTRQLTDPRGELADDPHADDEQIFADFRLQPTDGVQRCHDQMDVGALFP